MGLVNQEEFNKLKRKIESIENKLGDTNYDMRGVVRSEIADNSTIIEQSEMQYGMYTALCIETIDIWKQNRVRWYSPLFHNPTQTIKALPWAHPISAMGGFDDCGLTWVPPAGSTLGIVFENGNRASPYYIGTIWHRNRGPDGQHNWGINIDEYYRIHEGNRKGYLVGPNDGSQVMPPWNTENYNGFDLSSVVDFAENPEAQKLITNPNIYGFTTPEKHRVKLVDGDPRCNHKWKRFELMSSCGNWIMMKDDHLHYAGQWAHPSCGVKPGETSCVEGASNDSLSDVSSFGSGADSANIADETPKFGQKKEDAPCSGKKSNSKIIGGHPSTGSPNSKYHDSQAGSNPFFKNEQECRPFRGPGTPQNNVCDLPQSGIQIMSISGHTFFMDDSVEEPSGEPGWNRATESFSFGCNDHYLGRMMFKSATGHSIEISDVESPPGDEGANLRGEFNYIKMLTASGNKIELNDHTQPSGVAGEKRGIHLQSTSNHIFEMIDEENEQKSPNRMEGGIPVPKAKKARIKIKTGYGLEMSFNDDFSQEETQEQNIQIFCPQKDNTVRGPHIQRYQEAKSGPGLVFLRVGGNYVVSVYDDMTEIVGDSELNPADKVEIISRSKLVYSKDSYINMSDKSHIFVAKDVIMLLAGQDCPDNGKLGPCYGAVLVYDYSSGEIKISDRVFASTSPASQTASIFQMLPFVAK